MHRRRVCLSVCLSVRHTLVLPSTSTETLVFWYRLLYHYPRKHPQSKASNETGVGKTSKMSVCPSVCPSVTRLYCHRLAQKLLVFWYRLLYHYPRKHPQSKASNETEVGKTSKNADIRPISHYISETI